VCGLVNHTGLGLPARLSPEPPRVKWLDDAERPEGTRFAGCNRHRTVGEWWTVSYVVQVEERRVSGWAAIDFGGRYGDPAPGPRKDPGPGAGALSVLRPLRAPSIWAPRE
jgi:hypothetical protein